MTQLILFKEMQEYELVKELDSLRNQIGNVRRGIFARHSELVKMYLENKEELENIKKELKNENRSHRNTRNRKNHIDLPISCAC